MARETTCKYIQCTYVFVKQLYSDDTEKRKRRQFY